MYSSSAISEKIMELRKANKLTQEDFAVKIGVSKGGISSFELEKSKPSIDNLIKIAEEFQVSVDWLLSKEDSKPSQSVTIGTITGHGNTSGIDNKVKGGMGDQDCQQKLALALAENESLKREINTLNRLISALENQLTTKQ